jgi:hypothetical protein
MLVELLLDSFRQAIMFMNFIDLHEERSKQANQIPPNANDFLAII